MPLPSRVRLSRPSACTGGVRLIALLRTLGNIKIQRPTVLCSMCLSLFAMTDVLGLYSMVHVHTFLLSNMRQIIEALSNTSIRDVVALKKVVLIRISSENKNWTIIRLIKVAGATFIRHR